MSDRRGGWALAWLVSASVALGTVGGALGQGPNRNAPAGKAARKGRNVDRGAQRKRPPNAADPLAAQNRDEAAPAGSYHFRLKVHADDGTTLATSYYPAKLGTSSPVVLLVHEKDRSGKDFEDSIADLKGVGLAEHLQAAGYAVLSIDLRGYGANTRRPMSDRDWREMMSDLQAVYQFLVDRHNRGELNLAKLGVVALGEGANLVAAWAYQPGGAVSSEGRVTDLAALALVSPLAQGEGYNFTTLMSALSARVPVLLMAGERDALSHETVKRVRAGVEKVRQNRVELFPSSLHGYKLLRLEPRAASAVNKFLETTVKLKASDWEPRYNLSPVAYTDIQVVRHVKPDDRGKAEVKEKEKEKAAPKARAKDEAEKEKGKGAEAGARKDQEK